MGEGAAETAALNCDGWIDIEMVKTLSRPLSQQQHPNRSEPTGQPRLDLLEKDEVRAMRGLVDG
jgi:hypothetical protein